MSSIEESDAHRLFDVRILQCFTKFIKRDVIVPGRNFRGNQLTRKRKGRSREHTGENRALIYRGKARFRNRRLPVSISFFERSVGDANELFLANVRADLREKWKHMIESDGCKYS